jgi:hypothetical protein
VITVVPGIRLYTTPVDEPIVATERFELLHVPPATASLSVTEAPAHTVDGPAIRPGVVTTFTVTVEKHPDPSVYVMVTLPAVGPPVTTPEEEPMLATGGLLLLHVPPGVGSDKVTDEPAHTVVGPIMPPAGEPRCRPMGVLIELKPLNEQVTMQR